MLFLQARILRYLASLTRSIDSLQAEISHAPYELASPRRQAFEPCVPSYPCFHTGKDEVICTEGEPMFQIRDSQHSLVSASRKSVSPLLF